MENLIIEPLKGYGDIKFGMSIDEVVNVFGTPSNHEELEPIIEGNEISSIGKQFLQIFAVNSLFCSFFGTDVATVWAEGGRGELILIFDNVLHIFLFIFCLHTEPPTTLFSRFFYLFYTFYAIFVA